MLDDETKRRAMMRLGATDDDFRACNLAVPTPEERQATESSDSVPHVHHVAEAHQWWADAFPQHTKENPNG